METKIPPNSEEDSEAKQKKSQQAAMAGIGINEPPQPQEDCLFAGRLFQSLWYSVVAAEKNAKKKIDRPG